MAHKTSSQLRTLAAKQLTQASRNLIVAGMNGEGDDIKSLGIFLNILSGRLIFKPTPAPQGKTLTL